MKSAASIHSPLFFNASLPMSGAWGTKSQRISRQQRASVRRPRLSTDEFASSRSEVVCGSLLALCSLYTFAHCFFQLV